jgi:ribosomal protein L22
MLNENEYKNKLKGMYKKAAQRSLRMSQKYSQEPNSHVKGQGYNRALYPSVNQISKYESAKQTSNQR